MAIIAIAFWSRAGRFSFSTHWLHSMHLALCVDRWTVFSKVCRIGMGHTIRRTVWTAFMTMPTASIRGWVWWNDWREIGSIPIKSSAENASASQTCNVSLGGTFSSDSSHEKNVAFAQGKIMVDRKEHNLLGYKEMDYNQVFSCQKTCSL